MQEVEVIAVTANSGYDANTGEDSEEEDRELPGTVTLLVSPEQSRVLAELEADGKLHLSLVYRGTKENASKFIEAQEELLLELYAPEEEAEGEENGEEESAEGENQEGAGNVPENLEDTVDNAEKAEPTEGTEKTNGNPESENGGE